MRNENLMILDKINKTGDIKNVSPEDYDKLASELRDFIVEKVGANGGHLASNLGVVELTMAMHIVFDLPYDKLIFDVGHQAYIHKILSGRKSEFDTLRQFKGLSGFPKRSESDCDVFDTGHSSTSLSIGLGMANARDILGEDNNIVSVIGDGALTGGMAFEALNNISKYSGKFIIVLNDNKMSISENKGGVSTLLNNIRVNKSYNEFKEGVVTSLSKMKNGDKIVEQLRKTKNDLKHMVLPTSIFDDLGIKYLGPIDGHNTEKLIKAFNIAKHSKRPIILHVVTQKGKGYRPALKNPEKFHGIGPFNVKNGKPISGEKLTYTKFFSESLIELAKDDKKICAITASMPVGTGTDAFEALYPERYFDVGIAEAHAVTFAAGLANGGLKPVVAVYSSFLQRAYDSILHDVCLQNLPVVFAIDRAGIVGADGQTHQGIYDLSYLSIIPNLTVLAPKDGYELKEMLRFAFDMHSPVAIRYARGEAYDSGIKTPMDLSSELIFEGGDIALISVGNMYEVALDVCNRLKDMGNNTTLVNARVISPLDTDMLDRLSKKHKLIVTLEENIYSGGYGEAVLAYYKKTNAKCKVMTYSLPDTYVEHGDVSSLRKKYGLNSLSVVTGIVNSLNA